MESMAELFVAERERRGLVGVGQRVPEELRDLAVRYGRWSRAEGIGLAAASRALGVRPATLERWMERGSSASGGPVLREVVVRGPAVEAGDGESLTVTTPDGFRIEGIRPGSLAALLAALR